MCPFQLEVMMINRMVLVTMAITMMAFYLPGTLRAADAFHGLTAQEVQSLSQSFDFLDNQLRDMLRAIDKDAPLVEHRWSITGKGWFLDSFSRDNLAQTASKEMLQLLNKTQEGQPLAKSLTTLLYGQLAYDWGQESGSSKGKATALLRTRIQECLSGLAPLREQLGEHSFGKDRKSYGCLPMNQRIHCLRLMVRLQKDLQATKGNEASLVEAYNAMFTLPSWRVSSQGSQLFAQRFYEMKGYIDQVAQTGGRQEALNLHPSKNGKLSGSKLSAGSNDEKGKREAASALQTTVAQKERELATEMAALSQYLMSAELFKKDEQYYKSPIALALSPNGEFGDLFNSPLASTDGNPGGNTNPDGNLNMLGVENQQETVTTLPYAEDSGSTGSTGFGNQQWQSTGSGIDTTPGFETNPGTDLGTAINTGDYLNARDELSQAGWQEQDIPGPDNSVLQALLTAFRSASFSHLAGSAISIPQNTRDDQPLD